MRLSILGRGSVFLVFCLVTAAQGTRPSRSSPAPGGTRVYERGWSRVFDPAGLGGASSVALEALPSGGFVVAGQASATELWIARMNAQGSPAWERTLGFTLPDHELLAQPSLSVEGQTLYLTQFFVRDPLHDEEFLLLVARLTLAGDLVWSRVFSGEVYLQNSPPGASDPNVVAIDGGLYLNFTYSTAGSGFGDSAQVVRMDELGNVLWSKILLASGFTNAADVAPASNGDLLLLLSTSDEYPFVHVARMNPAGQLVWGYYYSTTPSVRYDTPRSVLPTPDGGAVLVGGSTFTPVAWAFAVDGDGAVEWSKRWVDPGPVEPYRFVPTWATSTSDGGLAIAGNVVEKATGSTDMWITRLGPAGDVLSWSRGLGGVGSDGGLFVASLPTLDSLLLGGVTTGSLATSGVWLTRLPSSGFVELTPGSGAVLHERRPTSWDDAALVRDPPRWLPFDSQVINRPSTVSIPSLQFLPVISPVRNLSD